jgi:cation:H+ antiporter
LAALSIELLIAVFAAATAVVALCGVRMTELADRLADRTGLGEAIAGGMLLGMATSLSGTVVSITAAADGRASLAFANAIGGIAAQTAFLALADILYRKANLEHASAELANLFQTGILTLMLSLPLVAVTGPEVSILGVHPVSLLLPLLYVLGSRATRQVREAPMWRPVPTRETRTDRPEEARTGTRGILSLLAGFAVMAALLTLAGWAISRTGGALSDRVGLSETTVGALMTAVATSLPELVTTLAAVRRGAVQLAVGGIIGGNTFDVLFLTLSDIAYREGSLYHAVGAGDLFWLAMGLAMSSVLMLGLLIRERRGPAGIGVESTALLLLYLAAVAVQSGRG